MGESASAAACDPAADGPGDAELIARVRRGDTAAYERLYTRHRKAAQSAARRYAPRASDADDLVAEAFTSVLEAIRKGAGPREFFRAYLVRTIANYGFRTGKQQRRAVLTDVWEGYDQAEQPPDTAADAFDRKAVVSAFRSLPERWQAVLWHTEIEGETPAAVAPLLGLNANGVSALAYRAREGLRTAYVQAHLTHAPSESCRRYVDRLSAYVRDKLGKRDAAGVHGHLDSCDHCRGLYLELADVSAALRASVAPVLLGAAAAGYLVSASGSTATATATVPPRPRRLPRPRRPRLPGRGLTTSAVVGAAAVAAGTAWALVSAGGADHAVKDGQGAAGKPARPLPAVSSGPPAAEPPTAEPAQSEPTPDGGARPEPSSLLVIPAASTPPPVPADPLPTTAAPGPTRPPAPEPSTAEPKRTANPGPGPGNSPEPQPTPTPGPSVTPDPGPSTTPTPKPSTTPTPGPSTTPDPKPSTTPDPKPSTTPGPDPTGGTGCEPGDWSGHGHWCPCTDHHWFPGCKPRTAPAVAARPPAPMRLPYPVAWSRPGDGRRPAA
ncbi:sigma-70 family RNA polymerase sigma factor [Peterkaempfera bronchialis]|uniref:sigma-70 family RNA polymerase sigma factor n=1 Tax=Peterkaempfera bronchialis TaxID=2126346 RepID=UPI003C2F0494